MASHSFRLRQVFTLAGLLLTTEILLNLPGGAAMAMTLNSPAFKQDGQIPSKYTCEGDDISPPLAWNGVPEGTKSLVLITIPMRLIRKHHSGCGSIGSSTTCPLTRRACPKTQARQS